MAVAPRALTRAPQKQVSDELVRQYIRPAILYALLIGIGIVLLMPFILAAIGSFKTDAEIIAWPPRFFPANWLTENWGQGVDHRSWRGRHLPTLAVQHRLPVGDHCRAGGHRLFHGRLCVCAVAVPWPRCDVQLHAGHDDRSPVQ